MRQFKPGQLQTGSLYPISASYALTASYASNGGGGSNLNTGSFATTGSNIFVGNQIVTGSLFTTGSNLLIGTTTLTGSLNITGSTTQTGNNTLLGNTTLSGSIIISGSTTTPATPTIKVYGDVVTNGVIKFDPVVKNIDTSITGSYIYVSGSTNDLYFSQNGEGYNNVTRLRWLEGNMYTGLLHGGLLSTASSTTFNLSSGSGIVVNLNASLNKNPFPTIQYVNWDNFTNQPLTYRTSAIQTFVGISAAGTIIQQTDPWNDGQYNTSISIGTILHQNTASINGTISYPNTAYGYKQRTYDFIKAFGPLKLSGYTLYTSGTLGLTVGSGTAFADGRNYQTDPNNPSYITDAGTSVSKIFRYHVSASTYIQDTNGGVGYTVIDPAQYNNNGVLTSVPSNKPWSNQRVFYYPNSVTKGIVVYYGSATYASDTEAIANLPYENFQETPNTQQNAIYLGAITIRYNGVFTNASDYKVLPGGIFRSVGGSGGGGAISTLLSGLSDVIIANPTDGQPLVYDTAAAHWKNSSTLTATLTGNASTATTASYAQTASYVTNSVSSSFATSASYSVTSSYILNAVSASFATSASRAVSASMAILAPTYLPLAGGTLSGNLSAPGKLFTFQDLALGSGTTLGIITSDGGKPIYFRPNGIASNTTAVFWPNGGLTIKYAPGALTQNTNLALDVSGAVGITGSLNVLQGITASGSVIITGSLNVSNGITGSLRGTSSYSETSSAAMLTTVGSGDTRSFALTMVVSASAAPPSFTSPQNPSPLVIRDEIIFNGLTKVLQTTASVALTASQATSASFATNSSQATSASFATSSSIAVTASKSAIQILTSADTRSFALTMVESNTATSTNNPAPIAIHSGKPLTYTVTGTAGILNTTSSFATSASYSETAQTASYVLNAVSASYALSASWAPGGVGGSDTQIQFNNGGTLAGNSSLTFDKNVESFANGKSNTATGNWSHAEGETTITFGTASHAEGNSTSANANYSHAEGIATETLGIYSHAEGNSTKTVGQSSHAEGYGSITGYGVYSCSINLGVVEIDAAQGDMTATFYDGRLIYFGNISNIGANIVTGIVTASFYNGTLTTFQLLNDGATTIASAGILDKDGPIPYQLGGYGAHAEGSTTAAIGDFSHAEGDSSTTWGNYSHAEGNATTYANYSHAEGAGNTYGAYSHAESNGVTISAYSHAEGTAIAGQGAYSTNGIAAGVITFPAYYGDLTSIFAPSIKIYVNDTAHSAVLIHEVASSLINGSNETEVTLVDTTYDPQTSYLIGLQGNSQPTYADQQFGESSHAEGSNTLTLANFSHAEGYYTTTHGNYQNVVGQFNAPVSIPSSFVIGNGVDDTTRSNLLVAYGNTVQITGSLSVSGSIHGTVSSIVKGEATIDFGATPGSNYATTTISTPFVTNNSNIHIYIMSTASVDHNAIEHQMFSLYGTVMPDNIIDNTSFDIIALSQLRLDGTFKVRYTINNN